MFSETTESGCEKTLLISLHFTKMLLIVCPKGNERNMEIDWNIILMYSVAITNWRSSCSSEQFKNFAKHCKKKNPSKPLIFCIKITDTSLKFKNRNKNK